MTSASRCWCGETRLEAFGGGYRSCPTCDSLVRIDWPTGALDRVEDEDGDLYGRDYWFGHQRRLGHPDLESRSIDDLGERCLAWLRTLLRHQSPGGRSLEIGAAHGGFVAMLRDVGFDAAGVELSPWICDFASRTFAVPMHCGRIEDLDLESPYRVVVAMDVLEHLPDPAATFTRAASWLADDGVLLVQTPCRPCDEAGEPRGYETLRADEHRFLEMMISEHLHLLSVRAATMLCHRVGLAHVAFESAHVPDYDMCFLAARVPLTPRKDAAVRDDLRARPRARMIAALERLGWAHEAVQADLAAARRDQQAQRDLVTRTTEALAAVRADQATKEELIQQLSETLAAVRTDQAAKETLIREISEELAEVRADQSAKEALIQRMARASAS